MHTVEPEDIVWALQREYCNDLRAAGCEDDIEKIAYSHCACPLEAGATSIIS